MASGPAITMVATLFSTSESIMVPTINTTNKKNIEKIFRKSLAKSILNDF